MFRFEFIILSTCMNLTFRTTKPFNFLTTRTMMESLFKLFRKLLVTNLYSIEFYNLTSGEVSTGIWWSDPYNNSPNIDTRWFGLHVTCNISIDLITYLNLDSQPSLLALLLCSMASGLDQQCTIKILYFSHHVEVTMCPFCNIRLKLVHH